MLRWGSSDLPAIAERSEHSPGESWNRQSGRVVRVCMRVSGRVGRLRTQKLLLECSEELISRSTVTCFVSQLRGVESPLKGEGADSFH